MNSEHSSAPFAFNLAKKEAKALGIDLLIDYKLKDGTGVRLVIDTWSGIPPPT